VPDSESASRQLLPRHERKASILQAAARAFGRGGYATTSMDDVAAEAGVSRLIVYRHFASKEELYRAVLEQVRGRIRERMNPALEEPTPGQYPFRPLIEVARENPDAFRLLFLHAAREPQFSEYVRESRAGGVRLAEDIIADLVGDTVSDSVMRTWATRAMVGYIFEALQAWLEVGDPARDDEFVERATFGAVAVFSVLTGIAQPDQPAPKLSGPLESDQFSSGSATSAT
jgi:AcrR family transcriptional regulator